MIFFDEKKKIIHDYNNVQYSPMRMSGTRKKKFHIFFFYTFGKYKYIHMQTISIDTIPSVDVAFAAVFFFIFILLLLSSFIFLAFGNNKFACGCVRMACCVWQSLTKYINAMAVFFSFCCLKMLFYMYSHLLILFFFYSFIFIFHSVGIVYKIVFFLYSMLFCIVDKCMRYLLNMYKIVSSRS